MTRPADRYDVVVVGAGLVGLAAAALLAQQGVRVLAVERHAGTSVHPKARLVTVRSMEIYRALGIEAEVRAAGEPNLGFDVAETLTDGVQSWIAPAADEVASAGLSPTSPYSCDQQRLEPILLRRARELGAVVEFGTAATLVDADELEVTLDLVADGTTRQVRARHVIAADGHRSGLRERLGIAMAGEDVPGESISAVFRADLEPALHGREINAVMCRAAGAFLFARGNQDHRSWQLGTFLRPGWAELTPELLREKLVEVIRVATGLPDLDVTIEDHARWSTGAYLADRFRSGRVFLVGDAAHVMPPYGGFGGNTGVQDAHNLAWKIATVVRGEAPDALLDTYERERRPFDGLVVAQALLRSRKKPGDPPPPDQVDATALALGFRYQNDGRVEDPASPSGEPGTRAPHVEFTDGGSTLDLIDPTGFTLIGHSDLDQELSATRNVRVVGVARDEVAASFRPRWDATYARGDRAGLLIRPDGVIAAALVRPTSTEIASALLPLFSNKPGP